MEERLQKIIARAGIASRRHAEQLILSGAVTVNGKVVTTLGTKADAERDHITVGPRVVRPSPDAALRYFVFNKPPQVVSTLNDPEGRPCLGPYLRAASGGRLFPVGRLEFDTAGLLVLTSDGVLASDLMRSAAAIPQVWRFKVRGRIPDEKRKEIERQAGVELRLYREGDNPWYETAVGNAPRDAVRQLLFRSGFPVEKAVRSGFGGVDLNSLPPGEMRELAPGEVVSLRKAAQGQLKAELPKQEGKKPRPFVAGPRTPRFHSPRPAGAKRAHGKRGSAENHRERRGHFGRGSGQGPAGGHAEGQRRFGAPRPPQREGRDQVQAPGGRREWSHKGPKRDSRPGPGGSERRFGPARTGSHGKPAHAGKPSRPFRGPGKKRDDRRGPGDKRRG